MRREKGEKRKEIWGGYRRRNEKERKFI